ncbi:MAG: sporulation protein YqfD [Clostridia bacterium]|nr:sporulation protein YqfD [Clostridia bacterium]
MFIKILLSYILGYIKITIEGYFAERFINICTNKKILLWNIKKINQATSSANISIKDFKKIRPISKTTKCKIEIKNKKGLPFLFERYKKRKILLILFLILIINLLIISNFIWNIEIECDGEINKQEIEDILTKSGLEIGKLKSNIDTNKVIQNIRYEREDIAWAGIKINGTNAIINLIKATEKPNIIPQDEYCNIVSDKEGIITKINVQNGTATVKVGELVKKGTPLVNGWLEGKYTGIRYVHSIADIQAKVWYSKKQRVYKSQEVKTYAGNCETKYKIKINNFEINLFKTLSKFQNYDTIVENKKLKIFSDFYLPIEIEKIQNSETEKTQKTFSAEELKEINIPIIEKEIEETIKNKEGIINKQINIDEKEKYIDIEIIYEVLEEIGIEEKIVF